jgi:hypothetical protein
VLVRSHDLAAFFEVIILLLLGVDNENFLYRPKRYIFNALAPLRLSDVLSRDSFLAEHSLGLPLHCAPVLGLHQLLLHILLVLFLRKHTVDRWPSLL